MVVPVDLPDQLVGFRTLAPEKGRQVFFGDPAVFPEIRRQLLQGVICLIVGGLPAIELQSAAAADPVGGFGVNVGNIGGSYLAQAAGHGVDGLPDVGDCPGGEP